MRTISLKSFENVCIQYPDGSKRIIQRKENDPFVEDWKNAIYRAAIEAVKEGKDFVEIYECSKYSNVRKFPKKEKIINDFSVHEALDIIGNSIGRTVNIRKGSSDLYSIYGSDMDKKIKRGNRRNFAIILNGSFKTAVMVNLKKQQTEESAEDIL